MSRASTPRTRVLPNRNAVGLIAVLLGMWYAGLTQSNGAAYLLCFVLAGVALVSIVHAWANLQGIQVEAQVVRAVFAGETLAVNLRVSSARKRIRLGIRIVPAGSGTAAEFATVPADGTVNGQMLTNPAQRGKFASLAVRIESIYPLGFFTASTAITIPAPHHVYPAPRGERSLPIDPRPARTGSGGLRAEGDDFGGVRAWQVGESQRHIDWKAVARGQPLVVKQWAGDAEAIVHLEWGRLPDLPVEARLSQLSRWVVQAENGSQPYALHLPNCTLAAARGESHARACLQCLAEFPVEEAKA